MGELIDISIMLTLFALVLSLVQSKLVVSSYDELYRGAWTGSLDADMILSQARLVSEVTQRSPDCPDIEEFVRVYEYFLIGESGKEERTLMDAQMPIDLTNECHNDNDQHGRTMD